MRLPAEHACGGRTEVPDRSTFVDDDHRVGYGFEDRAQMRPTPGQARGRGLGLHPCMLKPFSADGNSKGDHKKSRCLVPAAALDRAAAADTQKHRTSDVPGQREEVSEK